MNEDQLEVNKQIEVMVDKLQVDNHDYETPFPVAVATAPTTEKRDMPFFHMSAVQLAHPVNLYCKVL